jgi:hypothetical protein
MKNPRLALSSLFVLALCAGLSRPDPVVSAMDEAGLAFLDALEEDQRERCTFDFSDGERTAWTYFPGKRAGLMIGDLSPEARARLTTLMQSALSSGGYLKAEGVMILEGVLQELQPNAGRDPGKYAVTMFGQPGEGPWGWTLEGHHLSLNFTADASGLRSTPLMFGVIPAVVRDGPHRGLRILGAELDTARALIHSFNAEQLTAAQLKTDRPRDVVMGPARSEPFGEAGVQASSFDDAQQAMLVDLIAEYTGNLRWGPAQRARSRFLRLRVIRPEGVEPLSWVRFAFTGDLDSGLLYYRVTSGRTSFEYAAIGDDPDHAHALWRDLDQDFGADLLREHIIKEH